MNTATTKLLALLETLANAWPLPAVRHLHLPPPAAIGRRSGEFCALELDDGSIGLSFVLLGDTLANLHANHDGGLAGMPVLEIARRLGDANLEQRTLGLAAANAITRHLFDRAHFAPPATIDPLGGLDLEAGDHLGMIGLFPPLVPQVLAVGARLTVIELRDDLVRAHAKWHVTRDPRELAHCNKILSTSTVMVNDTLDGLLPYFQRAERVAMVGPGASCLPEALFDIGITALAGRWIVEPSTFVEALLTDKRWQHSASKFVLRRSDYPGFERLMERAAGSR